MEQPYRAQVLRPPTPPAPEWRRQIASAVSLLAAIAVVATACTCASPRAPLFVLGAAALALVAAARATARVVRAVRMRSPLRSLSAVAPAAVALAALHFIAAERCERTLMKRYIPAIQAYRAALGRYPSALGDVVIDAPAACNVVAPGPFGARMLRYWSFSDGRGALLVRTVHMPFGRITYDFEDRRFVYID